MTPGDLLSACPHRQFHTLPSLLDSRAALPNSNPNACVPMQGGSLYHFYDGLWYDPAERRTHDLPCDRRTCYRLSQPDTVCTTEDQPCDCILWWGGWHSLCLGITLHDVIAIESQISLQAGTVAVWSQMLNWRNHRGNTVVRTSAQYIVVVGDIPRVR